MKGAIHGYTHELTPEVSIVSFYFTGHYHVLETHTIRKLQLGAGTNVLENWFNTDILPTQSVYFLDSTKQFPVEDGMFHYVFSEHHIEHITYMQGLTTLRQCFRILVPGGGIRIATPNLETLLHLYTPLPNALEQRYIHFIMQTFLPEIHRSSAVFVINNAFRNWGHQFLYNREIVQAALEDAGFTDIISACPGESEDGQLRGIEKHGEYISDEDINRFETLVLEGRHP